MRTFPCLLLLLGASIIGCSPTRSVELTNTHWQTGDTLWFIVSTTDSVFEADSSYQHRKREKLVRFHVVEASATAQVEWQEFTYIDAGISPDEASVPGWWPAMRLVYGCGPQGELGALLNYPEVQAYVDTMAGLYLHSAGMTGENMAWIRTWALDSTRLIDKLMAEPALFHSCYGLHFGEDPKKAVRSSTGNGFDLLPRPDLFLSDDPLCDPAQQIGVSGSSITDSLTAATMIAEGGFPAPLSDTLSKLLPDANMRPRLFYRTCFDTTLSVPAYVEQTLRCSVLADADIQRTVLIHRR